MSGTIVYSVGVALGPDTIVSVRIQNVSLMDAPPEMTVVGEELITNPGQVPIAYEVTYSSEDIDERVTYGVTARIEDGTAIFCSSIPSWFL